jgi:zinc D-Ala-D-Ala carboxypeptidase
MKNFNKSEFDCPCCGKRQMDDIFLDRLDRARTEAGIPFVVNSGYRCENHNRTVGGKKTSDHLFGCGADIKAETGHIKYKIVRAAIMVGINRIGIGKTFIHLGTYEKNPKNVIWTY